MDTIIEKLNAIAAKCRALLTLAENRTPGRWVFSQDYGDERTQAVHTDEDEPWFLVEETHGSPHPKCNAAYIAACAGAAEAGWRTTLAAIAELDDMSEEGAYVLGSNIVAAWEGLL